MQQAHDNAEAVGDELARARRGSDVAYHVSNALSVVQILHCMRRSPVLSEAEVARLLAAFETVRPAVARLFHGPRDRHMAGAALDAACQLIQSWEAGAANAKVWAAFDFYRAGLLVRWLRNACHNCDIEEDLRRRDDALAALPEVPWLTSERLAQGLRSR